jgi:myo-inositol-1(or 4)-monophosphatase
MNKLSDLEIAKVAVKNAAAKLKKIEEDEIIIASENGKDIKLEADKISENVIISTLQRFSKYHILSEEGENFIDYSELNKVWIIDPLDGSLNFSRGIPLYCISVALWENGLPKLGVIFDLVRNQMFYGEIGKGAFCEGQAIYPSSINNRAKAVIATGFPVYRDYDSKALSKFINKIQEYKKVRLFGSAAMSILFVAQGIIDAYNEENIAIWDVAGALAILTAAGGKYQLKKGKENNLVHVFAANGKLI